MLARERWAPIPWLNGYQISTRGRVRNRRGRILAVQFTESRPRVVGYAKISIRRHTYKVHTLVMLCFGPPKPSPSHVIRHLDGDGWNARFENLRWGTQAENVADSILHGTHRNQNTGKKKCKRGHRLAGENLYIKPDGNRNCRACHREGEARRRRARHDRQQDPRERSDQPAPL
jgi:hypothetical protein